MPGPARTFAISLHLPARVGAFSCCCCFIFRVGSVLLAKEPHFCTGSIVVIIIVTNYTIAMQSEATISSSLCSFVRSVCLPANHIQLKLMRPTPDYSMRSKCINFAPLALCHCVDVLVIVVYIYVVIVESVFVFGPRSRHSINYHPLLPKVALGERWSSNQQIKCRGHIGCSCLLLSSA